MGVLSQQPPDIDATFCGLAGANATDNPPGMPGIDSIDQWPYLTGATQESPRTEILLASAFATHPKADTAVVNGSAALIVGKYKLVRYTQQVSNSPCAVLDRKLTT